MVGWLGYSRWASWRRCYVASLFDVPNIAPQAPSPVPVADWSRVRILTAGRFLGICHGTQECILRPVGRG
jgi:hypothetical protein